MKSRWNGARAGQWLGILGLCVALVVGCDTPPKTNPEAADSPETAQTATPPAPEAVQGTEATAAQPAEPPAKAAEQKAPNAEQPTAKADPQAEPTKPGAPAKPAATAKPATAADQEAMRKEIAARIRARAQAAAKGRLAANQANKRPRQAARTANEAGVASAHPAPGRRAIENDAVAKRKTAEARPTLPATRPAVNARPVSPTVAQAPAKPGQRQSAATGDKKSAGCGAKPKGELTMHPESGPQPKYTVKQQKVELNDVWMGEKARFVFEVGNEGQAPLDIHLKGG